MRIQNKWVVVIATLISSIWLPFVTAAEKSLTDLRGSRPDAATVVVKQGDAVLTLADIDTWMLEVPEKDRAGFIRSPERIENMLFQLLAMKQLNIDAQKSGLDQEAHVSRHMQYAAERILARYQTEAARDAIKVPDMSGLAEEKYLANPDTYRKPDIATVVHLLITEDKRGADAAQQLIQKLSKQVKKNPAKFDSLVMKYSEDPSAASNQGKLKDVSLATLDLAFAAAARKLEPGQISEPVKSDFGWHLIRLDAITRGRLPSFDELKDQIKADVEREYLDRTFRAYVDGLRQRKMDPDPKVLENLPYRYGGTPDTMNPPVEAPVKSAPTAPNAN